MQRNIQYFCSAITPICCHPVSVDMYIEGEALNALKFKEKGFQKTVGDFSGSVSGVSLIRGASTLLSATHNSETLFSVQHTVHNASALLNATHTP